jgi:hypothetical protein
MRLISLLVATCSYYRERRCSRITRPKRNNCGEYEHFFIYNDGSIFANNFGVEPEHSNDHFHNELSGSVPL